MVLCGFKERFPTYLARWRCRARGRCRRWTGRPVSPAGWRRWWPPCWQSGCWWVSTLGCSWCLFLGAPLTWDRERVDGIILTHWQQSKITTNKTNITLKWGLMIYLPLLWGVVTALLLGSIFLSVQGIAAACWHFARCRLLAAAPPPGQVHPRCTPQLQAHAHTHVQKWIGWKKLLPSSLFSECHSNLYRSYMKLLWLVVEPLFFPLLISPSCWGPSLPEVDSTQGQEHSSCDYLLFHS